VGIDLRGFEIGVAKPLANLVEEYTVPGEAECEGCGNSSAYKAKAEGLGPSALVSCVSDQSTFLALILILRVP
jgi:hypothetical protein